MSSTVDKGEFLRENDKTEEQFEKSQLDWNVLTAIHKHHSERTQELLNAAQPIVLTLQQLPPVHSVRLRIKEPGHVVEKIIRKQLEHLEAPDKHPKSYAECTRDNYGSMITDLIGVRALHLFKEQWLEIHELIKTNLDVQGRPEAYTRHTENQQLLDLFANAGCDVTPHPSRYASVHYIVLSKPLKEQLFVELQVRTIFEEAWAEVDHSERYPRRSEDPLLAGILLTFSLVAGFADELASFTKQLSRHLRETAEETAALRNRDKEEVAAARAAVQKLLDLTKMEKGQRVQLLAKIEHLERAASSHRDPAAAADWLAPLAATSARKWLAAEYWPGLATSVQQTDERAKQIHDLLATHLGMNEQQAKQICDLLAPHASIAKQTATPPAGKRSTPKNAGAPPGNRSTGPAAPPDQPDEKKGAEPSEPSKA